MAETHYDQLGAELLQCAMLDPELIDRAVADGFVADCLIKGDQQCRWNLVLELRAAGKPTDPASVAAYAVETGRIADCGGYGGFATATDLGTTGGAAAVSALLGGYARRSAWKILHRATEAVEADGTDMQAVGKMAEDLVGVCAGRGQQKARDLAAIDAEVGARQEAAKSGVRDERTVIKWGLPKCDRYMTPIESHEYAMICARPSTGKSSLLTHLAGHNLRRGLRIVYFSLETSDTSVFMQMAAQYAGVNLKLMGEWMPEHHRAFEAARKEIRDSKRLLIFDRDMSLAAVQARCRLLAQSFKPSAVMCDYLGLLQAEGKSQYERVTAASNAMIGLRKQLGCALICAHQLNRGPQSESREPTMADLRDSGHLEQDGHRIVMLHWKNNGLLDSPVRDYRVLQPKLRDGPTTAVDGIKFECKTTRFYESTDN